MQDASWQTSNGGSWAPRDKRKNDDDAFYQEQKIYQHTWVLITILLICIDRKISVQNEVWV